MQSKLNILFTELMQQSIVNNQSEKKQFFVSNEDKKNSRRNGRSIFRNLLTYLSYLSGLYFIKWSATDADRHHFPSKHYGP